MQQADSTEVQKKTYFKLLVECAVACSNPGCRKDFPSCGRADHLNFVQGPGAASPLTQQYSPGAQLTVTATCPHCGHRTEIPVVYSTHEEQPEGGHVHVTVKGNPFGEATTP